MEPAAAPPRAGWRLRRRPRRPSSRGASSSPRASALAHRPGLRGLSRTSTISAPGKRVRTSRTNGSAAAFSWRVSVAARARRRGSARPLPWTGPPPTAVRSTARWRRGGRWRCSGGHPGRAGTRSGPPRSARGGCPRSSAVRSRMSRSCIGQRHDVLEPAEARGRRRDGGAASGPGRSPLSGPPRAGAPPASSGARPGQRRGPPPRRSGIGGSGGRADGAGVLVRLGAAAAPPP